MKTTINPCHSLWIAMLTMLANTCICVCGNKSLESNYPVDEYRLIPIYMYMYMYSVQPSSILPHRNNYDSKFIMHINWICTCIFWWCAHSACFKYLAVIHSSSSSHNKRDVMHSCHNCGCVLHSFIIIIFDFILGGMLYLINWYNHHHGNRVSPSLWDTWSVWEFVT